MSNDLPNFDLPTFLKTFYRVLNFIPNFDDNITYNLGNVVAYEVDYKWIKYKSKVNNNAALPTNTANWEVVTRQINDIFLFDIENAQNEANVIFHKKLFQKAPTATKLLAYNYLIMHFVSYDAKNTDIFAFENTGLISSVSVSGTGGVSESYQNFAWASRDPMLANLCKSGWGNKYLALLEPYRTYNVLTVDQASTKVILN